ncbi:hypothetical protein [Escherichia sp. E1130]|uniref:hypothetical protein n=1 Tax=Escherichia sp. E1130 TaxID=2041645 RepID=UPI001080B79F|nr:hypothetical protein [Escherichia sp. E1130]TGC24413.1 hypothetical protein CQJ27_14190 [Escherichia sp. E1130]TLI62147.1 hypothetical protein FEK66_25540 [Escherichia sp. E1130]
MTVNNRLLPPHGDAIESDNHLQATINGLKFGAEIVGGRYDGEDHPEKWTKRYSWGRGKRSEADSTHTLIFITCDPGMINGKEYDLSEPNIPVSIQFTHLFPPDGEDESAYLKPVSEGKITLTHDFSRYLVTGRFSFNIIEEDGTQAAFQVVEGTLSVGPT